MREINSNIIQTENENGSKPSNLTLTQVKLLNCLGMMYSGDDRLQPLARRYQSDLLFFCNNEWAQTDLEASNNAEEVSQGWKLWYEAESRRRTGYCIWVHHTLLKCIRHLQFLQLLDCMWNFHFQTRPSLSLEDAKVPIPCQEVLWEAESALDWQQLYSCAARKHFEASKEFRI